MKNILVPTDFSDVSEDAANYAAEIAKSANAKLIFYYIFPFPLPIADIPVIAVPIEGLEKESMKLLHALDKRIKAKHGNIETELKTQPGFVVDEVITYTKEHKIDMVVMGVTGAGKTPGLFGSNATSVMHHAACPVMVIPKGYKFKKPAAIALACDYKSILPEGAINKFKTFVRLFHSKVLVCNVLKPKELATYQKAVTEVNLENALTDIDHALYFPAGNNLVEEINTFVKKHNVDILTMFPHHYSFLKGIMHHSATNEMTFLIDVPLLSIHE